MTICIAAICNGDLGLWYPDGPSKFLISDRMVSTDYTQSELPQPKFRNTVNSIMVLMSGVNDVTAEIFDRTHSYISDDFMNDPRLIPVERIANIYSENLITFLNNRREKICRARIGLKFDDFLKQYDTLPQILSEDIITEIKNEPETQTIITGIDENGAHIYLIDAHGVVSCKDSIGFAIIGSGDFHSHSQVMRTKYSPGASYCDTLLLMYMAKKQAEIDPWVGKDTDIFVIKNDRNYDVLPEETVIMLEDTYNEIYNKVLAEAKARISCYLIKKFQNAEN